MAIEGHTQSEFGRHAEQRDLWLVRIIQLCLAAHTAALYDPGDSEGADVHVDAEGIEKDADELQKERDDAGLNEDAEEYNPHMMYDPETKEGQMAETEAEHEELGEAGYVHEDKLADDEDDRSILELALDVTAEEREDDEMQRQTERDIRLVMPNGDVVITGEDIDSDFEIGFSEAGRSPLANQEMRSNILALSDKMLQLMDIATKGGPVGQMAEELLKTIHERFEFPPNLSFEYVQGKVAEKEEEQAAQQQVEQPQAQPQPERPTASCP